VITILKKTGFTTIKPLPLNPDEKVQPQITADNYEVAYAKDVWLMEMDELDENGK